MLFAPITRPSFEQLARSLASVLLAVIVWLQLTRVVVAVWAFVGKPTENGITMTNVTARPNLTVCSYGRPKGLMALKGPLQGAAAAVVSNGSRASRRIRSAVQSSLTTHDMIRFACRRR